MDDRHDDRQQIWHDLLFGQRSMMLRLTGELKRKHGLTTAQFEALTTLRTAGGPLTASALAGHLLYSSGAASHLLARLEERGLIRRTPSPEDARVQQVSLTEAGADLVGRAAREHVQALVEQFHPLVPEEEVEVLLRFSQRLAEHEGRSSSPDR